MTNDYWHLTLVLVTTADGGDCSGGYCSSLAVVSVGIWPTTAKSFHLVVGGS